MKDYTVTESSMLRVPFGMAWAIVGAIALGAFFAGLSYFQWKEMVVMIKQHDGDIKTIKAKLGISVDAPTTGTVAIY